MSSKADKSKVWIRFESKMADRVLKLRIQDLPKNRMDDFVAFLMSYYIKDEAFHKAAGIYNSQEAREEYKKALLKRYELNPPHISICCEDRGSEDFDEILAASMVQLMPQKVSVDDYLSKLENKEVRDFFNILKIVTQKYPKPLKDKYESYYHDRGLIVHPDYRKLSIATQIIKQRRLLCKEYKVPMTCAWMTSIGTQKVAERDGWEVVAEVTLEELDNLTGLTFVKDMPTYKLMMATVDC